MSIERKVNRVSMVADASSNGEVLIQNDEAVARNYDEQALCFRSYTKGQSPC